VGQVFNLSRSDADTGQAGKPVLRRLSGGFTLTDDGSCMSHSDRKASDADSARRRFAVEVAGRLHQAGYQAYWAGGCVRDHLLGRMPKDYDVATSATPREIRKLFGFRRTLAIGAAFGVITVLGPKGAGQIEVATFRRDVDYEDGRHPTSVEFTDAREDAIRRDFTINGMFYDPAAEEVIDFVGGREDLARGVIRAIGDPHERFSEDHLRMLRAVRFAATFDFTLDEGTRAAIVERAGRINSISAERTSQRLRRTRQGKGRAIATRMLLDTGLMAAVLPELEKSPPAWEETFAVLARLPSTTFEAPFAAVLYPEIDAAGSVQIGRRLKLSNREIDRTKFCLTHAVTLRAARRMPHSRLQPILVHDGIDDLLAIFDAIDRGARPVQTERTLHHCRCQLRRDRSDLDPPPLIDGGDLKSLGLSPGPLFRRILQMVRNEQLDRKLLTGEAAIARAIQLAGGT